MRIKRMGRIDKTFVGRAVERALVDYIRDRAIEADGVTLADLEGGSALVNWDYVANRGIASHRLRNEGGVLYATDAVQEREERALQWALEHYLDRNDYETEADALALLDQWRGEVTDD